MADITFITVTYGPSPLLRGTMESLARHAGTSSLERLVVTQPDIHGLTESSAGWMADVKIISLTQNLGFGLANNLAVEHCDSEFVAFINPDLAVTQGWLPPLLAALIDPQVAIAAPPLLNAEGYLEEVGQVIYGDGGTDNIGGPGWPGAYPSVMFSRDVDYASAACWVMRREVFRELGGFDERYAPAYFEDSDFALTARQKGLVTRLVADRPVIHHHDGASASRVSLAEKSRQTFTQKWSSHLSRQPDRLRSGEDGSRVRDHRSENRVAYVLEGAVSDSYLIKVATDIAQVALMRPRDRVALLVWDNPTIMELQRRFRTFGLEIIPTRCSPEELRPNWATEVHQVASELKIS